MAINYKRKDNAKHAYTQSTINHLSQLKRRETAVLVSSFSFIERIERPRSLHLRDC